MTEIEREREWGGSVGERERQRHRKRQRHSISDREMERQRHTESDRDGEREREREIDRFRSNLIKCSVHLYMAKCPFQKWQLIACYIEIFTENQLKNDT